jgi:hypothetical protein
MLRRSEDLMFPGVINWTWWSSCQNVNKERDKSPNEMEFYTTPPSD